MTFNPNQEDISARKGQEVLEYWVVGYVPRLIITLYDESSMVPIETIEKGNNFYNYNFCLP